jgi:hypothetical protein
MPEIEFTINTETGGCETEIKGIQGPACERAAQHLKNLLGDPSIDHKTKEFHMVPQTKRQIKGNER